MTRLQLLQGGVLLQGLEAAARVGGRGGRAPVADVSDGHLVCGEDVLVKACGQRVRHAGRHQQQHVLRAHQRRGQVQAPGGAGGVQGVGVRACRACRSADAAAWPAPGCQSHAPALPAPHLAVALTKTVSTPWPGCSARKSLVDWL